MALNWGDVPTWVAAIGTVSAVSLALWQNMVDRRTARTRAVRAQAELISAWYGGDRDDVTDLYLRNGSKQPIYEVVVCLVINLGGGEGVPDDFRHVYLELPPGLFRIEVPSHWHGMSARPGIEVSFTDRTGAKHWIRRAAGALVVSPEPAIEHYGISRPYSYEVTQPLPE